MPFFQGGFLFIGWLRSGNENNPNNSIMLSSDGSVNWNNVCWSNAVRPALQLNNLQRAETFIFTAAVRR